MTTKGPSTLAVWHSAVVLWLAASLFVSFAAVTAQEPVKGDSLAAPGTADPVGNLRNLAAKLRADGYTNIAAAIERQITEGRTPVNALLPALTAGEHIAFANQTDAAEGKQVFDGAVAGEVPLLANIAKVELFKVFDAATQPMRHNAGKPEHIDGAYSDLPLVGTSRSIMLWGPFETFDPGRYIIVYRLQFLDDVVGERICFLDVSSKAVTFTGRRPGAGAVPGHVWKEIAVPLGVAQNTQFEFRLWPQGKQVALDRIYLYRLTDRKDPGARRPVAVMGAVLQPGFYLLPDGKASADSLLKLAGGLIPIAHASQFMVWRQTGDEIAPVPIKEENAKADTVILPGDTVWVPERTPREAPYIR